MRRLPLFVAARGAFCALLWAGTAAAQQKPMAVITDTTDYCEELHRRLKACDTADADVLVLIREGQQMCDHGEVRGGILRLRRALLIARHSHAC